MRESNVAWSDILIDDCYINTHIPLLPPVIDQFRLCNAKFSTTTSADKFVSALRGRTVAVFLIERCVIPKAALLLIIMLMGQMQTRTLSLRGMGVDDQTCEYVGHFCRGTVRSLDVSYNPISSAGLGHILAMPLDHLDISGIQLDRVLGARHSVGWDDLFRCTTSLTARECFTSSRIGFGRACDEFRGRTWRIEVLDFSCNALQSYDAVKFFSAMARSTIRLLYFNHNRLDDRMLSVVPDLANVSCLFLDGNPMLTNAGVTYMLARYSVNVAMRHISVADCGLDATTMLAVCDANDDHRREKTATRARLMSFIGIPDIVEDALALL